MAEIVWAKRPEELSERIGDYGRLIVSRTGAAALDVARDAENEMKLRRPWNDISGNARRGLRTAVTGGGGRTATGQFTNQREIYVYFIHTVEYGIRLELDHGGRYAIVIPTLQRTVPKLRKALKGVANK